MRQFSPVIAILRFLAALVLLGVSGCTSLTPFQTVTPGVKPPPQAQASSALPVFGPATTVSNAAMAAEEEPPSGAAEAPAQGALPAGPAAAGPATTPVHPLAVCYNRWTASAEQVRSIAESACPGGALRFVGQGWNLDVCPVFTPVRAVFTCTTP